jgi:hypothetical protein
MTSVKFFMGFAAAALLPLPMESGAHGDRRRSRFRDMQPLRAASIQARGMDLALVLVSRGAKGSHSGYRSRARLCDRLSGPRDEPSVPATVVSALVGIAESADVVTTVTAAPVKTERERERRRK